jgi:predicted phage replisome organizer
MSNDVKWIKIKTDIFDDEKIKIIDTLPDNDAVIVIWFKLLTLAGKCNKNGALFLNNKISFTEEMLTAIFHRNISQIRMALDIFEKFEMIERGEYIQIANWNKHQNIEGMEKIRLQTKERVARYREKQTKSNVALSNVTVTHLELDKELDIDKDIKDIKTYCPFENEILTFWNDLDIIKHKLITDKTKKMINELIKSGISLEEIMLCMNRYNQVLKDETYFFKYKWSLEEFICRKKGILEFKEDGVKWLNYTDSKSGKKAVEVFNNNNSIEEMKKGGWL